jgi:hypothetical protein
MLTKLSAEFRNPSPALVIACLALFVALGGTTYAAVTLPRNSVKAKRIAKDAVGASEIKKSAVRTGEVKNGTLRAGDFAAGQLPQGPKGDPGQNGTDGAPGADGAPDVFARVGLEAGRPLQAGNTPPQFRGLEQANVVAGEAGAATGTTCFDLPSRPASAMVVLDNADTGAADRNLVASVSIDRGEDLGDCPAAFNDARVRIVDGNTETAQNARFFVWFEL